VCSFLKLVLTHCHCNLPLFLPQLTATNKLYMREGSLAPVYSMLLFGGVLKVHLDKALILVRGHSKSLVLVLRCFCKFVGVPAEGCGCCSQARERGGLSASFWGCINLATLSCMFIRSRPAKLDGQVWLVTTGTVEVYLQSKRT